MQKGVAVTGQFLNHGLIRPGGPGAAGVLNVAGDFLQSPTGRIEVDFLHPPEPGVDATLAARQLSSAAPDPRFDRIEITGTANLAGVFQLKMHNGLDLPVGASFDILHAESIVDSGFEVLMEPGDDPGVQMDATIVASEEGGDLLRLTVGSIGEIDTDGDGMDDAWELMHFGNLARDGTDYFETDGMSDLAEFLAGTDPTDPGSVLRVVELGEGVTLTWQAVPGARYQVQYKDRLTDGAWSEFPTIIEATGVTASVMDPEAAGVNERYYRIQLTPLVP